MDKSKKFKIAFFIGAFPKISESWFIEQLTDLLDMGADIDIFSFDKGSECDISEKVKKYDLLRKTTYLVYPKDWFARIFLGLVYFFKVLFLKPTALINHWRYCQTAPGGMTLKYLFWTAPLINKINDYAVIHCHFGMIGNKFLIIREILGLKQKFVVTFYGQDSSKYIQAKGEKIYDKLKRECSYFLLMTEEMKERFTRLNFPPEKLFVHYTGVNVNNYIYHYHQCATPDIFKIISVGRFVEKKGFEDAMRAVKIVAEQGQRVELNIVGGGEKEYGDKLKNMAREMGLENHVRFLGLLPHQETIDLFEDMHIMLQLSKRASNGDTDDLPFVLLEAQISGLPVITTNHVGIPDGVDDGRSGFVVGEGNYREAAKKILFFINNPQKLKGFSLNAHHFVKSKFDLAHLNRKLIALYKSL